MSKNPPKLALRHSGQAKQPVALRCQVRLPRKVRVKYHRKVVDWAPRQTISLVDRLGGIDAACYAIRESKDLLASFVRSGKLVILDPQEWEAYCPTFMEAVSAPSEAPKAPPAADPLPAAQASIVEPAQEPEPEPAPQEEPAYAGVPYDSEPSAQVASVFKRLDELYSDDSAIEVPAAQIEADLEAGGAAVEVAAALAAQEEVLQAARVAGESSRQGDPSADWSEEEIRNYAAERGINVEGALGKPALLRIIHSAR